MAEHETYSYDVLVIGAGGAGLRAAVEAAAAGARVGLVCKSLLGKAHTVMAEGGVAAALGNVDERDSWRVHFADTMRGGQYVNNWRMAELHAKEAPARVNELEAWGALFDRTGDGRILQRNFGGHRYPRLAHVGDRTGLEMIRTLQDHAVHESAVEVHMECTVTRLLNADGRVCGAVGYERERGRFRAFAARAVVLATGGIGRAYAITSNSWEYTGDGHSLAYHAGAALQDMEFVQFHPTGMVWPPGVKGLLVTEAVRGEGGILRNKDGERFMWKYLPEDRRGEYAATDEEAKRWVDAASRGQTSDARRPPELSTRDNVSRAIYTEVREGRGTEHGGVFLDISYLPADHVRRKLPSMYDQFKELADVDITKGAMEVGPTTHYVMGGVRVEAETGAATVPGLFAAGEVAGGMHGANRLGGNSLSDLLVFGQRTGAGAAAHAANRVDQPYLDPVQVREATRELAAPLERGVGEDPYALQRDLQEVMQRLVGIYRVEADLQEAIDEIAKLRTRLPGLAVRGGRVFTPGWNLVFEVRNLLVVSEAITRSALQRTESRGAHSRLDFPETDQEAWGGRNGVVRRRPDGSMEVATTAIPSIPEDLQALLGAAH